MPIYEYECTRCSHRFEVIQKFSDPPKKSCPECRAKVRKLISAPGIQFKGTGWYITDYARKGSSSPDATESNGGSAEKSSSSSETSGSTKKESAGDSKSKRAPRRAVSRRRGRRR
ncbi:MAG: FmdB family zinc ribbon protein [Acidobacteriota bacterium]|nr:zinc ribbon domain-containing protein [Acidobacteriota bacterium]